MTNAYTLRNHFTLGNYNTTITRAEFEAHFTKTRETVTFTFGGWDGKSYDGESRRAKVLRTDIPGYERGHPVHQGRQAPALHHGGRDADRKGHRRGPPGSQLAGGR